MYLPRLRRIADVLNEVKQVDPDTCRQRLGCQYGRIAVVCKRQKGEVK